MSTIQRCPRCGATLTPDRAGCPRCLLEAARAAPAGAAPSGDKPPSIEQLSADFPQLELEALVGQGGMGCVYRARHLQLGRTVALKILAPGAEDDGRFEERFLREARALAKLDHPGIVRVYDFGRAGLRWYLLMEFVEGANLRGLLDGGRLSPELALSIVPQLCDALEYAHSVGVVHRDIKPENVLIDASGRVKLADFGLAKMLDAPLAERTATDVVMGTLNYMAPEQMSRPRDVDHRADIYSLGVVFYEMLTGELPRGRFEPPSKHVKVHVRIDEVVLKSLEQSPDRRYQHASEVRTDLEQPWPEASVPPVAPRAPDAELPSMRPRIAALTVALWIAASVGLWVVYWMFAYRFGLSGMALHGAAQALVAFACLRRGIVESDESRRFVRVAIFAVALACGFGAWTLRSVASWEETTSTNWAPDRFAASLDLVQPETERAVEVAYGPKRVVVGQTSNWRTWENSDLDRLNDKGWTLIAGIAWALAGTALLTTRGKSHWRAVILASLTTLGVPLVSSAMVSDGYRALAPDRRPAKPDMGTCMSRTGHLGAYQIVCQWIEDQGLGRVHESEWTIELDGKRMDGYYARLLVADEPSRFDRWKFGPLHGPRPRIFPKLEFVLVCVHTIGATTVVWRAEHVEDSARRAEFESALSDLTKRLTD